MPPLGPRRPLPLKKPKPPDQAAVEWDPVIAGQWAAAQHRAGIDPATGRPYPKPQPKPPGAPPVSPQGESQRIGASGALAGSIPGINQNLMQAAMHYGVGPTVTQVGLDPSGGETSSLANVTADPNSVMAGITRGLQTGERTLGENMESGNTFFSSLHQRGRSELEGGAARDRAQAATDFNNAVNNILTGQWTPALAARGIGLGQATQTDIENAPPSSGPPPPAEIPLPAPSPKNAAFALAKARGDVQQKHGKWYYKRSDGKWIPM